MGTYIISIAAATVLSAAISILTPEGWGKYVGIVTGLVVMICIARPIISITGANFFDGFQGMEIKMSERHNNIYYDEVKRELEARINDDAKKRLKTEFNKNCEVKSEVAVTEAGTVKGVLKMEISGDKPDAVAIGRIREVYGADEVNYVGVKKTAQKS